MVYVKTWALFVRAIYAYLFSKGSNNMYSLAGRKLLRLSFRYPDKDRVSRMFFFKAYIKSLLVGKLQVESAYKRYSPGGLFFYDDIESDRTEKMRIGHIQYFSKQQVSGSIWRNKLEGYFSAGDKILQWIFESLLFVFLLPVGLFSALPASVGVIFREYIELVNLLKVLKKNDVKTLYFYSIYHKDSNLDSIAVQKMGIEVIKVTSLTPIKFWNSIVVAADKLVLCDVNQFDEVETFKDTIQVKKIEVWGPENVTEVVGHYKEGNIYDINKNVLGFYSTATYIREMDGLLEQFNMKKNEDKVKLYLAEYLKSHTDVKLIIFPHPKEKQERNKVVVAEHYKGIFGGQNYIIYDSPLSSAECFEKCDLGVAMYSSVIYERLYFGFKCLMMPFGEEGLAIPGKAMANICAVNKDDFFAKIDAYKAQSTSEYFKTTGIKESFFMKERKGVSV
jgi:hypothetical protein